MYQKYLVTGASGFLGRAVISFLKKKDADIYALVLEKDPLAGELPEGINIVYGDVCSNPELDLFFKEADDNTCVIHCAGIVSVASHPGDRIYCVNVGGTNNILQQCEKKGVGRMIYVSSVHAIPEKPKGIEITEDTAFSPELVQGDYAKSKAIATSLVFSAAGRGLNASVVFPSGIIGPGDVGKGSITSMLLNYISGRLSLAVEGGYDFVDVRDVAEGIVACAELGKPGRGYILSGQYATIRDILSAARDALHIRRPVSFLPLWVAKLIAPAYEKTCLNYKRPLYFTPYSIIVLGSNGCFSHAEAARDLGYSPRSLESSISDTVKWLQNSTIQKNSVSKNKIIEYKAYI